MKLIVFTYKPGCIFQDEFVFGMGVFFLMKKISEDLEIFLRNLNQSLYIYIVYLCTN